MVNRTIDDPKDAYFIFFEDLNFEEVEKKNFDKLDKDWNGKVIYFKVHKYNTGTTQSFYRGFFAHSGYKFYDHKNQEINVYEGGFRLWSIYEKIDRSREVIYYIIDSKNRNRQFLNTELSRNWSDFFQIEGIKSILLLLRDLGNIKGFEVYDMRQENATLKVLNKKLTNKLTSLQDSLNN